MSENENFSENTESCTHDCSTCSANCSSRSSSKEDFQEKPNAHSKIRRVIGIVSGKGGVGKSLVTSLLASEMSRRGLKTAVLDADITGPSIPRMFGLKGMAFANDDGILPVETATGIRVMSLNLLQEDETDPVVWRGPVIAGAVKQFWTDVVWGEVDFMFVDMPPGTGDVPLTVFQSLPLDGIIIVASPQELVGMIVEKAVKMAGLMDIPVLGMVENMSYFLCPDCGKQHSIFGESRIDQAAAEHGVSQVAKLPIDPSFARICDMGQVETISGVWLSKLADSLENLPEKA